MLVQYLINVKPLFVAYAPRPDEGMIVRYVQPLTDEQRALLEKTMKEDTAFRARSRAHSLLLSAAGTPIQTIATRVCMITLAAADQAHAPQTNRNSPNNISKKSPVLSKEWWSASPTKPRSASVSRRSNVWPKRHVFDGNG